MVVNSYTIVHYGKDYLPFALNSVAPFCERNFIFYTPHPSHGHQADVPPIESRDELVSAISHLPQSSWIENGNFYYEGQQRDYALAVASKGADLVLVLDYDEVWPAETLEAMLAHVWQANSARHWLVNMIHLWRSFNWACTDDGWPVRIIDTRHSSGMAYLSRELGPVYHFGYAITDQVMKYKLAIHGHRDELRPGWLEEKWQAWPPVGDCHPTNGRKENGEGWWDPKPFDRRRLPELMQGHKWWLAERIE